MGWGGPGLERCAGEDGGGTLQRLDSLKIALDPGVPGKRVSATGSRRPGPLYSHPVGLLRENTEHPPRWGVRAQWSFLNLCLSPIAVTENNYFKYHFLGQVGPTPNSFLQEWTGYKPGFPLKPSLTVLPKSCLSFQTPKKSKPNCFYLKVSLRRRKEL